MRLIDGDALKNELSDKDYITYTHEYGDAIPINWIMNAIDNAPTVTIKEWKKEMPIYIKDAMLEALRPQGKWIDTGDMNEYWAEEYQCSICGGKDHWHKFCPNCGADMRKEAENESSFTV